MDTNIKFQQLEQEILPYRKIMGKAADSIFDQNVSSYPIFVVHQLSIDIGIAIAQPSETLGKWAINASTLEEFVTKQVIQMDKIDNFKQVYKKPDTHLCLFILSDLGATFVFIPRN